MHTLGRLFWLFILALVWLFNIERAEEREHCMEEHPDRPRYGVYFPNDVLIWFLGILAVITPLIPGDDMEKQLWAMCFSIFLHAGIYYVFLALVMPLIRRYCNARVCASLWLLPNYLYIITNDIISPASPKRAVYIPPDILRSLTVVWAVGFGAVMVWKVAGHFRFRHRVLKGAVPAAPEVQQLWEEEQLRAGYPQVPYLLVTSPAVTTPLTVGFVKKTIRVVLPRREYTDEELRLILHHEIIHIGREDSRTKFFFAFCTAMCWFNPLMWWAMRRSADDLELSCDETVLLDADRDKRRQYADLLLRTAGDERGFTTCLSASARALRYRLHWVMLAKKRFTGSFLASVILFLLLFSCGHVALAFEKTTGAQAIFGGEDPAGFSIDDNAVVWDRGSGYSFSTPRDADALKAYLAGLELYDVSDLYEFDKGEQRMNVDFNRGKEFIWVTLYDHALRVKSHDDRWRYRYYFIEEGADWQYLGSLLPLGGSPVSN